MTDRLIITLLPDGRALALGEAEFRAALAAGEAFAAPALPPLAGPAPPPRLVDSRELSELVGVGDTTLEAMAARGEIPSLRIGKALRFDPADVLRHLKSPGHADSRTAPHMQAHDLHGRNGPNNQKNTGQKCPRNRPAIPGPPGPRSPGAPQT